MDVKMQTGQAVLGSQEGRPAPPINTERETRETASIEAITLPKIDQGEDRRTLARVTHYLKEEDISDYMLDEAFASANKVLAGGDFRLSYGVHEATNRIIVAVYDTNTDEIIREIPPESRLDIYARITEFVGLMFDQSS